MAVNQLMKLNPISMFLAFLFAVLFAGNISAQSLTIAGNEYELINGAWYKMFNDRKGDRIIPSRLIVRLQDGGNVQNLDFDTVTMNSILNIGNRFLDGFYVISVKDPQSSFTVAETLEKSGRFEVIEFDAYGKRTATPGDLLYSYQWNLKEDKIRMESTWDLATGNNSVILAIIDSGIDYDHEDLDRNIWGNLGWDFAGGDNNPQPPYSPDADPFDTDGHGTAVAGIAGAQIHNFENGYYRGIAGIAGGWGNAQGVQLMILRDGGENPIVSLTAQAICYAADNDAKVINISSGFSSANTVLENAVNYAADNYDVVIIASAGNSGESSHQEERVLRWPARYSKTIAVGATDQNDNRWTGSLEEGSCIGNQANGIILDIMAPGGVSVIWTTDITGAGGYSSGKYYTSFGGTSASAPHVAGVTA